MCFSLSAIFSFYIDLFSLYMLCTSNELNATDDCLLVNDYMHPLAQNLMTCFNTSCRDGNEVPKI